MDFASTLIIIILTSTYILSSDGNKQLNSSRENIPTKNLFVIQVDGNENVAKSIANELNLVYRGPVGSLENLYLVEKHQKQSRLRRKKDSIDVLNLLLIHKSILFVEEQIVLRQRVKRGYFHDPDFEKQWYLQRNQATESCNFDLNIVNVWKSGLTGRNVTVSIIDDGIEHSHPDLTKNYDSRASYDYIDNDPDPMRKYAYDNKNQHGTRCAGEVAAEGGNEFCGVGVAYNANIGGIRLIDAPTTDAAEAAAFSYNWNHIDIYSNSWGPDDNGKTMDGPMRLGEKAIQEGAKKGRNGLGSIYVWASGNGGSVDDYCSCDGFVNMPETIAINAIDQCGNIPYYAESCPGILATAYSSSQSKWKIFTTDLNGRCTSSHSGTSAAAPLAAGIFALVLEANRNVTWRDLQHLIVKTSKITNQAHWSWIRNGAGYQFSIYYGFGVLDASSIVAMALDSKWHTVNEQHICKSKNYMSPLNDPNRINNKLKLTHNSNGCIEEGNSVCVKTLEHVIVVLSLKSKPRGGLQITLRSPSGTESPLLNPRSRDMKEDVIDNWKFMSVGFWGENPDGTWVLSITQRSSDANEAGYLHSWQIILYGTCDENLVSAEIRSKSYIGFYIGMAGFGGVFLLVALVVLLYRFCKKWLRLKFRATPPTRLVTFSNEGLEPEPVM